MRKQLYRSQKNKVIAGVCGGIAEHLDVDPVLVRLVYILLTFGTGLGPGLIVYIIAWIIIPLPVVAPTKPVEPEPVKDDSAAV
jgi:phage shock protein C